MREADAQAEMAARIASERLSAVLGEPITPLLATLYSERAFVAAEGEELELAALQFVRALAAIWQARPAYCDGPRLRRFIAVEWARRFVSFRRRGIVLPRPERALSSPLPMAEGALRGLLDELSLPRLSSRLPRTHP
jgi:hypothetical protein